MHRVSQPLLPEEDAIDDPEDDDDFDPTTPGDLWFCLMNRRSGRAEGHRILPDGQACDTYACQKR